MTIDENYEVTGNEGAASRKEAGNHTVSVIIPTYNRSRVLKECLRAVLGQTYTSIQVIVTDDSQNDLVKTVLKETGDESRIEYRRNTTRLGLPANRNAGLTLARGQLVVFLDDDAVMEIDCIERLVSTYADLSANGVKIGAIGPSLMTEQEGKQARFLEFGLRSLSAHQSSPVMRNRFTGISRMSFSPEHSGIMRVDELHSNSMYVRQVLDRVGGYEEQLYQGNYLCEETDLHARIKRAGFGLYFNSSAVIHHKHAESGGCRTSSIRYGYYFFRNHAIYITRNYRLRSIYMVPCLSLYLAVFGFFMATRYAVAKAHSNREKD